MRHCFSRMKWFAGMVFILTVTVTGIFATDRDAWEDSLTRILQTSRTLQLPLEPLENKIREGRAKNRPPAEIFAVVKHRQQLLLQIRGNRKGAFSEGYTKQLFDLERSNTPVTTTIERNKDTTMPRKLHQPQAPAESSSIRERKRSTTSSEKKTVVLPDKNGQGAEKAEPMGRQMDKAAAKAEKTMEKTASRAEKRMESIQKRVQKRTMKRRGVED